MLPTRPTKWCSVTKANPCPICEHGDWCGRSEDGQLVICMRVPNDHPTKNGGYLYKWDGAAFRAVPARSSLPVVNYTSPALPGAEKRLKAPIRGISFSVRLTPEQVGAEIERDTEKNSWFDGLQTIAGAMETAGVNAYCDLGVFLSKQYRYTLGFPMRDATGTAVGVRYRSSLDSHKWSLKGGADGLFLPLSLLRTKGATVFVTEGASDTLALASLGLAVVGRSSCSTGVKQIQELFRMIRPSECVVMGDRESVKQLRGVAYLPGMEGAKRLASALRCPCKIAYPLFSKDIRALLLDMRHKGKPTEALRRTVAGIVRDAEQL